MTMFLPPSLRAIKDVVVVVNFYVLFLLHHFPDIYMSNLKSIYNTARAVVKNVPQLSLTPKLGIGRKLNLSSQFQVFTGRSEI